MHCGRKGAPPPLQARLEYQVPGPPAVATMTVEGVEIAGLTGLVVEEGGFSGGCSVKVPWAVLSDGWKPYELFHGLEAVVADIARWRRELETRELKYVPVNTGAAGYHVTASKGSGVRLAMDLRADHVCGDFERII
jgi:hypothetical protein